MDKFIVRGFSMDRMTKIFVKVKTVQEIILEMSTKLKLDQTADYQVVQESDGTIIDDDDILANLCIEAKSQRNTFGVMLLPAGQPWSSTSSPSTDLHRGGSTSLSSIENITGNETSSDSGCDTTPSRSRSICFPMSEVTDFLDPLVEKLNGGHLPKNFYTLKKKAVKEAFHAAGKHMLKTSNFSKSTALKLSQFIIDYNGNKYKKIFEVQVGSAVADPGYKYFCQKIYAYVCANKGEENTNKRGTPRRNRTTESECEEDGLLPPPPSKQDLYGCVAFAVPLPGGEDEASQELKRERLLALEDEEEVLALMSATYPSQRADINSAKPLISCLEGVINKWPHLAKEEPFLSHSKTLLGKDVKRVWEVNVGEKSHHLFQFMDKHFEHEATKKDPSPQSKKMLELISEARDLDKGRRSSVASCSSLFPLILGYMNEAHDAVYVIVPETATPEEIFEAAKGSKGFPLLVIRGSSFFDYLDASVILPGRTRILVSNLVNGFLITLLTYFTFLTVYNPGAHSSLEFYQRFFLQVNPPEGTKRAVKKKTVDPVDCKVRALAEK